MNTSTAKRTADKRIGIVGGGQLGKMMILEAKRLGFHVTVLDPSPDCPAHSICDYHIIGGFEAEKGYRKLAECVDVITYEYEHINTKALKALENKGHIIYPSVTALEAIQNKYSQKTTMQNSGIPVPKFCKIETAEEIRTCGKKGNLKYPLMLKTATGGYDGKGNALIASENDVEAAFTSLSSTGAELMAEEFIEFEKEISIIACRDTFGKKVIYPIAENTHIDSILDMTVVSAGIDGETARKAADIAGKVMTVFDGVGTFCIEMFVTKDGDVFVNEVAPRPHNSGHYTIEATFANQFENHIRAVTGLPLGDVSLISPAVMVNILGQNYGKANLIGLDLAYSYPNVHVHLYGKTFSKKGRKMGHFTVVDTDVEKAKNLAVELKSILKVIGS
ncbi:MAG: 5-(carboxyamino)imidazole ribonucleotide synthase [Oscillospiraceae bacterium]|nr:5-(carboxyamino)imidazole ribonucleotide synthase [Oscillospiraceae bacterium]